MNRHAIKSTAIMLAVLSFGICESAVADGNEMLTKCQTALRYLDGNTTGDSSDDVNFGTCLGFFQGANNMLVLWSSAENGPNICFPKDGISNGQGVRIFVKFLTDHPEKLHEHEVSLLIGAMMEAFPCD